MDKTEIAIIGAGTAGMSAGIYAKRAGREVVIFEGYMPGGQIVVTQEIDNYPATGKLSGFDFAMALVRQTEELGIKIISENVDSVQRTDMGFVLTHAGKELYAKTVIIATGAKNRKLGLEEEQRFIGKGVSYCATCDGAYYKDKTVAVVGGGNTAIEDAEVLSRLSKKVYIIHRRDEFRAESMKVEELKKKQNVEFVTSSRVVQIKGENKVEAIVVQHNDGTQREIATDGLFVAIGQEPSTSMFKGLVEMDEGGYIKAGEDCVAGEGIFVAGDCRTKKIRQLVTAASDGSIAALAASEYCGKNR